jgi:hypothetical protein
VHRTTCRPERRSCERRYAVAIGGTAANENLEATPLAEDGFLYITDQWGVHS